MQIVKDRRSERNSIMLRNRPWWFLNITAFIFVKPLCRHTGTEICWFSMEFRRTLLIQGIAECGTRIDLVTEHPYSVIWKMAPWTRCFSCSTEVLASISMARAEVAIYFEGRFCFDTTYFGILHHQLQADTVPLVLVGGCDSSRDGSAFPLWSPWKIRSGRALPGRDRWWDGWEVERERLKVMVAFESPPFLPLKVYLLFKGICSCE